MDSRNIYQDKASGVKSQRVGLKNALDFMKKGDCLIVWKLDRLGRSLPHLIQIVAELKARCHSSKWSSAILDKTLLK